MSETKIEWTHQPGYEGETWNPTLGCDKISPGCKGCYAIRSDSRLEIPLKKRKPTCYFVNSLSDLFHEEIPDEFIDRVFAVMAFCPQHLFIVLTKRSKRMREYLAAPNRADLIDKAALEIMHDRESFPHAVTCYIHLVQTVAVHWPSLSHWPLRNVQLGVSVENQATADERIPDLLATPAATRIVSYEPALGPVDFTVTPPATGSYPINGAIVADISGCLPRWQSYPMRAKLSNGIDQVIAGGESGPNARPAHPDWFRSVRDQCVAAGVAFFFKQWGEWNEAMQLVGKKTAGHLLDGDEWRQFPVVNR